MELKYSNNKIELLCKKKLMDDNWASFSPDSIVSAMASLTDEEIQEFLCLTDSKIESIDEQVNNWYKERN